jgi:uncharacterized cupin superfamily protein
MGDARLRDGVFIGLESSSMISGPAPMQFGSSSEYAIVLEGEIVAVSEDDETVLKADDVLILGARKLCREDMQHTLS